MNQPIDDINLLRNYWHLVAHAHELANEGDYVCIEAFGQYIAVFNDGLGLVAFDNICPHRGARIFPVGRGNQKAICPYHGWAFRRGRIIVSNASSFVNSDINNATLTKYHIDFCGQFLFVSIEPRLTLKDQLYGLFDFLNDKSINIGELGDVNAYKYRCIWPVAIENALEPYHINMIHPSSLGRLRLSQGVDSFFDYGSIWRSEVREEKISRKLNRICNFLTGPKFFKGYEFVYLFPFSMISSTFSLSFSIQNFFPDHNRFTNFESRLYHVKYKNQNEANCLRVLFDSTSTLNRQIFSEDREICERVSASSWSMASLKYPAHSEAKVQHFRGIIRRHYE